MFIEFLLDLDLLPDLLGGDDDDAAIESNRFCDDDDEGGAMPINVLRAAC